MKAHSADLICAMSAKASRPTRPICHITASDPLTVSDRTTQ